MSEVRQDREDCAHDASYSPKTRQLWHGNYLRRFDKRFLKYTTGSLPRRTRVALIAINAKPANEGGLFARYCIVQGRKAFGCEFAIACGDKARKCCSYFSRVAATSNIRACYGLRKCHYIECIWRNVVRGRQNNGHV